MSISNVMVARLAKFDRSEIVYMVTCLTSVLHAFFNVMSFSSRH